jgi:hypothetical protein
MAKRKDLIVVALATFCLTASVFMIGSIKSAGVGEYDPWADINNDGFVDIYDAILLSNAFSTHGPRARYDSGWVNITDKAGQNIDFSHGLGTLDWNDEGVIVEITGKTVAEGELLRRLGLQQLQAWNRTYGGADYDHARSVVQTVDGGYAIAGDTYSFGAGLSDFWLVTTDSYGNMVWNRTYGGTEFDVANALLQTTDGGYAIAGRTDSFGAADFWLVKTDSVGNALWNKTYGGANIEEAFGLVQTSDGGYALAGITHSYGAGSFDFWLVKTDADGNLMWDRTYGGAGLDYAYSLVQTVDGGYALAGQTDPFGTGDQNFWLVKTDAEGNEMWNRTYGGGHAHALIQTGDGGYALAGTTGHAYLVKTDSYGNMVWNRTYEGTYVDAAAALVQTIDGGYALAGHIVSSGAEPADFWLVKTDADGDEVWNRTYGEAFGAEALALVQTIDGGYALAGYAYSSIAGIWHSDSLLVKTNSDGKSLNGEHGLTWVDSTNGTVTLYRGKQDSCWNFVRVRIMKAKE